MLEANIFRELSPEEAKEFVNWTLDNWKPNTPVNSVWHPLIRRTWSQLDASFETSKKQILADMEEILLTHREE